MGQAEGIVELGEEEIVEVILLKLEKGVIGWPAFGRDGVSADPGEGGRDFLRCEARQHIERSLHKTRGGTQFAVEFRDEIAGDCAAGDARGNTLVVFEALEEVRLGEVRHGLVDDQRGFVGVETRRNVTACQDGPALAGEAVHEFGKKTRENALFPLRRCWRCGHEAFQIIQDEKQAVFVQNLDGHLEAQ